MRKEAHAFIPGTGFPLGITEGNPPLSATHD
jgi:hypothetical protein